MNKRIASILGSDNKEDVIFLITILENNGHDYYRIGNLFRKIKNHYNIKLMVFHSVISIEIDKYMKNKHTGRTEYMSWIRYINNEKDKGHNEFR